MGLGLLSTRKLLSHWKRTFWENSFQGEDFQILQTWNRVFEKRWHLHLNSCMPIVALCNEHVPEATTTMTDYRFVYIWLALQGLITSCQITINK